MTTELPLESVDVMKWLKGTPKQRSYQADRLIEQVGELGLAAIVDNGEIVTPQNRRDVYRVIDLLLRQLPEEVRRERIVHPSDVNLGYSWPGRESYKEGQPETWKRFIRIGERNGSWDEINRCWLPDDVLDHHFSSDDAAFLRHFQKVTVYDFFEQFFRFSTFPLNMIAHHYFGLSDTYFNGTRRVGDREYHLVKTNTLQLLAYLTGTNPVTDQPAQLGDLFAGEHEDSSTGTIGDTTLDPYNCLESKNRQGEWFTPVLEKGANFFQFGRTYAALAAALAQEGVVDLDHCKYGTMNATRHRVVRKDLTHPRNMVAGFNHPSLDMPIGSTTAGGVLKQVSLDIQKPADEYRQ